MAEPDSDACRSMHDSIVRAVRIPQWAFVVALGIIGTLAMLVYDSVADDVKKLEKEKADVAAVAAIADEIEAVKADVDYLVRRSEADLVDATVNRRLLNALARDAGLEDGGPLREPRPAPTRVP